jgi:hypothetical protein
MFALILFVNVEPIHSAINREIHLYANKLLELRPRVARNVCPTMNVKIMLMALFASLMADSMMGNA